MVRSRRAEVRLDGRRVGELRERPPYGSEFRYAEAWLSRPEAWPISLRLPLRAEPYVQERGLLPFFDNLLPEGWLLSVVLDDRRLTREDPFGILLATGRDTVGAVEVVELPPLVSSDAETPSEPAP